jgi:hypothetical protein
MKVQLFKIGIDAERIIRDQNYLNDFLSKVAFMESSAHFVESENAHWSILIYYEEKEADLLQEPVESSPIHQGPTGQPER